MTILNWGRSVGNVTISPTTIVSIPRLLGEVVGVDPGYTAFPFSPAPRNLVFPEGLFFEYDAKSNDDAVVDNNGNVITPATATGTFFTDANGQLIPRYGKPFSTTNGDDVLVAYGYPPGSLSSGVYINALDLTTIRLGDGDDFFGIKGVGITQSVRSEVNIDESQGYIFQSNVFGGGGDDRISVLMPWQSVFKGGSNTDYSGTVLSDDLTVEELVDGDVIVLKGSRFDWDIEFKDGNGDGVVTLASVLDETDYLAVSNNNQISGFERILFGDILFDLVLYDQLESSAIFGQPEYFLNGAENTAPQLNSTISDGSSLWEAFRFNRTFLEGIAGTATAPVEVYTGDAGDTPHLVGALRFASLFTQLGDDIVVVGSADQASVDLGDGLDQFEVKGLFREATLNGGDGADNLILDSAANSRVLGGSGDDVFELKTTAASSLFDGGAGVGDRMLLPGTLASYGLTYSTDGSGTPVFRDRTGNSYVGIETFLFSDGPVTASQIQADIDANQIDGDDPDVITFNVDAARWLDLAGNAVSFKGAVGTATNPITVQTGSRPDTPTIGLEGNTSALVAPPDGLASLRFATLSTQEGDDVVRLGTSESATVDTGIGNDQVEVFGLMTNTTLRGGDGTDALLIRADFSGLPAGTPNGPATDSTGSFYRLGTNRFYGFETVQIDKPPPAAPTPTPTPSPSPSPAPSPSPTPGPSPSPAPTPTPTPTPIPTPTPTLPTFPPITDAGSNGFSPRPTPTPGVTDGSSNTVIISEGPPSPGGGVILRADPFVTTTQVLVGTPAADELTGGSGPDVLEGGPGADQVTGGFGADTFVLPFGGPSVDTFVDFNPNEDRIQINNVPRGSRVGRAFRGRTQSRDGLTTVDGKKEARFAESPYIYDADSGRLFFNANGDKKGFGKAGGVIAQLTPGLELNGSDLVISYVDPLG